MDRDYIVVKDIPLNKEGTKVIPTDTSITCRTVMGHRVYYMNGGQLSNDYQVDFDNLIDYESKNGWNYLVPIKEKVAFQNDKEDL
jgi:hypothetical protein